MGRYVFEMEVVLPMTNAGVRDLLSTLAHDLKKDAERYMKGNKCDKNYPAVQDKLKWAKAIARIVDREDKASKKRWQEEKDRQQEEDDKFMEGLGEKE